MARRYTLHDPVQGDILKTKHHNENWGNILQAVNGTMDHLQVNTDSVPDVFTDFGEINTNTIPNSPANQRVTVGQFETYAMNSLYAVSGNEETPAAVVESFSAQYQTGWNELRSLSAFADYAWIATPCREGMLTGAAVLDFAHRVSSTRYTDGEGSTVQNAGYGDWVEVGVFVNNILLATTGHIPPGRFTVTLPFMLPVGSQVISVDLRWRAYFGASWFTATAGTFVQVERRPVEFYNCHLWARNQYR